MIHELSVPELRRTCDPKLLPDETAMELGQVGPIIGQERAVRAMQFGVDIQSWGFDIYLAGMAGTGRATAVERFVEEIALTKPTPIDWCYVYNFDDNYRPRALGLPAGKAREFQKDVMGFLKMAIRDLHIAFEGDDYAAQQENPKETQVLPDNLIREKDKKLNYRSPFLAAGDRVWRDLSWGGDRTCPCAFDGITAI